MKPFTSLYLHIPFCRHRCAYCDFNTYAGQEDSIPAYIEAICREIEFIGQNAPEQLNLHTVFFGGGTPSLLTPHQFDTILAAISRNFDLVNPEITIEANPGTVSLPALKDLRSLGINRISFGVQSANPSELRMLEREHSYFDVINAVTWARKAGFDNLNLDLIYGLPLQTLEDWSATVKLVMGLAPEHLSLYALTLEHGTPFGRWSARGLMPLPDPDLAADMYEWAGETLEAAGYQQYEISNWSKQGLECQHNLQYWRGLPYLAAGAGAHGYINGYRYSNMLRIKTYIDRLLDHWESGIGNRESTQSPSPNSRFRAFEFPLTPVTVNYHRQSPQDDMGEFMMTGLRLTREGVSAGTFRQRFGREMDTVFGREIEDLIRLGLLELADPPVPMGGGQGEVLQSEVRVRLTPRGRLLGNQAFVRFVA